MPNGNHQQAGSASALTVPPADRYALAQAQFRTQVAIEVSAARFHSFNEECEQIEAVVDDVVKQWLAGTATGRPRDPATLAAFVADYISAVELDEDGNRHWQFFIPDEDGQLYPDSRYDRRVWSYHAGCLRRARRAAVARRRASGHPVPEGLPAPLAAERVRTQVAIELAPMVYEPLDKDRARVGLVVDDVLAAWQARPDSGQPLLGSGGFVGEYLGQVLYEKEDEKGEHYRPQFLPPGTTGGAVDVPAYDRRVWQHHVTRLMAAQRSLPADLART